MTDFGRDVVVFVTRSLRWPTRSWLSQRRQCGACGESLTMLPRRTTRPVTVDLPDVPVFTLTLEHQAARCPACGLENVYERRAGQVAGAVSAAVDAGLIGSAEAPHDAVINVEP